MRLNEAGVKSPMRSRARRRPPPRVPADLRAALARSQKARATYAALSPSGKRDYVEWITGAKRAETRARRLARSVAMLARGKPHTWQYSKR
jgi:uncharacterized protein YdeI (YjbR/CyaY-like superfamily)